MYYDEWALFVIDYCEFRSNVCSNEKCIFCFKGKNNRNSNFIVILKLLCSLNQGNRGKPLIRIISDTDAPSGSGKDPEMLPKRPTPTLTITIPSNEEEIRSLSSPESISPLPSSAQDSGGSSPQRPRMRQDILSLKEFKRQVGRVICTEF